MITISVIVLTDGSLVLRRGITQDAHDKFVTAAGKQLFTEAFSSEPSEEEKKRHEAFKTLYEIMDDDVMPQIGKLCINNLEGLNVSLITAEKTFGVRQREGGTRKRKGK